MRRRRPILGRERGETYHLWKGRPESEAERTRSRKGVGSLVDQLSMLLLDQGLAVEACPRRSPYLMVMEVEALIFQRNTCELVDDLLP